MKKIVLAFLILLMTAALAAADTIYLRDGRTVRGTILGFIDGRFVVRLDSSNKTASGQQVGNTSSTSGNASNESGDIIFVRPADIERVEIEGRSLDDARFVTRTVQVSLGPNWVDSGVDLRRGERVQVKANGVIYAGRTRITPDGLRSTDPNAPLPRAAEGVLIGTVSTDPDAPITEIGLNREFVADRDGRLYLTANRSNYTDARGAFNVQIRTERDFNQTSASNTNQDRNNDQYDPFGAGSSNQQNNSQPAPVRPRTGNNQASTGTGTSTGTANRVTREKTIDVPANLSRGVDTGIDLRSGDQVTITATGSVTAGRKAGVVSPEGGRVGAAAIFGAGTYPVPQAGVGALVGYIRLTNGQVTQPFFIGSQFTLNVPVDGRLFLLVNDDNYSDNTGSFQVRITYPEMLR